MTGIFEAPPDGYINIPLLGGEQVVHQQTACALKNNLSVTGGQLVITNQRLVFRPIDLSKVTGLFRQTVDFLPDGLGVLGKIVDKALDYTTAYSDGAAGAIETSAVSAVRPGLSAAISHPPSIVLSLSSGHTVEIGILHSIGSPNFSSKNTTARDNVVRLISDFLSQNGLG